MTLADDELRLAARDLIDDLVELRLNRGLTQAKIAKIVGTSASAVSCYEHHRRTPGLLVLLRYAAAVGADLTFVMRRPNSPQQ